MDTNTTSLRGITVLLPATALSLLFSNGALAQTPPDSTALQLHEVVVSSSAITDVRPSGKGDLRIRSGALADGMRVMGEADILNRLKNIGGISSGSDYGSGLSIDGADPDQTLFSINGMPLMFPYRFGGLFSTFTSAHFTGANFERYIHSASMPSVLGSTIEFTPRCDVGEPLSFMANIGLLSSTISAQIPAGKKFALAATGRVSYVNALYSGLIRSSGMDIGYDFADLNISAAYAPGPTDKIHFEAYAGNDRLGYGDPHYDLDAGLQWRNLAASVMWTRSDSSVNARNRAFFTRFTSNLSMDMSGFRLSVPSEITGTGISGDFRLKTADESAGYELTLYAIKPLCASLTGLGEGPVNNVSATAHSLTARVYADKRRQLNATFSLRLGISASLWASAHSAPEWSVDPRVTLSADLGKHMLNLHLGTYSQYLHRVGFSEIGLASDFFIGSSRDLPAQHAASAALTWDYNPHHSCSVQVGLYGRLVDGQSEYHGQILDMINRGYDPLDHIVTGHGYNAGVNISASKSAGRLTGTASYSFGIAMRKYPDTKGFCRGAYSPGHRTNLSATYRISPRWTLSAQFVYAQGRPYTPVTAAYVIANNVIKVNGRRNSSSLPDYHRLDLSATYSFKTRWASREVTNRINISLINAYGRKNVELQSYDIDLHTGHLYLNQRHSLYRFLPSLSYSIDL